MYDLIYLKSTIMIFKQRGLTVGDSIILLIVILISFFTINKIKESNAQKQITNLYQLELLKNISK